MHAFTRPDRWLHMPTTTAPVHDSSLQQLPTVITNTEDLCQLSGYHLGVAVAAQIRMLACKPSPHILTQCSPTLKTHAFSNSIVQGTFTSLTLSPSLHHQGSCHTQHFQTAISMVHKSCKHSLVLSISTGKVLRNPSSTSYCTKDTASPAPTWPLPSQSPTAS